MRLTARQVERAIKEFPTCIECGNEYWHVSLCQRGRGLPAKELHDRLKDRVSKLVPETPFRCRCGECSVGTAWIAYHNKSAMLEVFPACSRHSTFEDTRPHGFLPGLLTKNLAEVQRKVFGIWLQK
jgi:hypothetical protein